MDLDAEDYYLQTKNQKIRKLAIAYRRRESTWRKRERSITGAVDGVTKRIQAAGDWDAERINQFCEDVLEDGGLIETDAIRCSKLVDGEISLKKNKGWLICDHIRKAAMHNANDSEMPDVVIIEKVGKPGWVRTFKPDVTHATYSVTTPVANPSKREPNEKRLVVDKQCGRSYYFCEASIDDEIKKAAKGSQSRPEVTYIFRSPYSLCLRPEGKIKNFYRKMPNARCNSRKEEVDAHYEDERWEDFPFSDNEADSGNDDMDVVMEPPKALELNLGDEIAAALSMKNDRRSKSGKGRKQRAVVERPTNKGKVISLPLSERTGDVNLQEDRPSRNAIAFILPTETIHHFITHHEITRSEGVSIANSAPVSFTIDLRPPHSNNIKDGFCHLIFETDYDPDMFEFTDDDYCNVQVTPFSNNEKTVLAMSEGISDLLSTVSANGEPDVSIEQILATARSVIEPLDTQPNTYHKVEPGNTDKKGTRNFNICEDLAKKMGMRSSAFSTVDNLRHSVKSPESEPDEDYDFEMVPDISKTADECRSCGRPFGEQENSGTAIRDCRHWFCKLCWSNHLCQSEDFIGKCMEPGCNSTMNYTMKLILRSYKHMLSQRLSCGRIGDEFAYLCPNSSCGRVTKTTFSVGEPSILTCSCETAWCGKCGNEPHWPASCAAAEMQSLEYIAMSLKSSTMRYTKECPQCQKTIERKSVRGWNLSCPHCSYVFYCWRCVGSCANDHESRVKCSIRQYRSFENRPCKREEVPETKTLCLPGFSPDVNIPDKVYESIFNLMKSLRSHDFENKVRRRAASYVGQGLKDKHGEDIMPIVMDLLFARNQVCFFIVWITAEMRYGKLKGSSKRKYIQGILKKLESARNAIDWLLITRDYACNDGAFPEAYILNVTKVNSLLKLAINAFR